MKSFSRLRIKTLLVLFCCAVPSWLNAHHSLAPFDISVNQTIDGTVKEVWFNNPHVRYFVSVVDEQGQEVIWDVHTSSVNTLLRRGWTSDSVKVGDHVSMLGSPPRDGTAQLLIHTVEFPDGSKVSTRTSDLDR